MSRTNLQGRRPDLNDFRRSKRPPKAAAALLMEFIGIVGKLGGHLGRKSGGP